MGAGIPPGVSHLQVSSGIKQITTNSPSVLGVMIQANRGIPNKPTFVTNWSQVQQEFGDLIAGSYGMYALKFMMEYGGADQVYVVRIAPSALDAATITIVADTLAFELESPGVDGEDFKIVINKHPVISDSYSVSLQAPVNGVDQELWFAENLSGDPAEANYWVDYVVSECKWLKLSGDDDSISTTLSTAMGSDLSKSFSATAIDPAPTTEVPISTDYIGSSTSGTGLYAFDQIPEIRALMIPDDVIVKDGSAAAAHVAVYTAAIGWCVSSTYANKKVIYVTSIPYGKTVSEAKTYAIDTMSMNNDNACIYYNWIKIIDPLSTYKFIPPSAQGLAAWYVTDRGEEGVHKAPANVPCNGVVALEHEYLTDAERGLLNDAGINPHIKLNGSYLTFGARMRTNNTEWTYIHVRRTYIMLWTSIVDSSWDLPFNVKDVRNFASIRRRITAFLRTYDRRTNPQGALENSDNPADVPYYVICNTSNQTGARQGEVFVDCGFNIVDTMEFVKFRTSLWNGQADLIRGA